MDLTIEGFLRDDEAKLLTNLASKVKKGVIVEIGSYKGKSTVCLAKGSSEGKKEIIYAIDPHTGSEEHWQKGKKIDTYTEFLNNIKRSGFTSLVKPIRATSAEAVIGFKNKIALLFIDGDHSDEAVRRDFNLWKDKLINGGIIAFHDTISWPGPQKLVNETLFKSQNFKNFSVVGSITYAEKTNELTVSDRIQRSWVLILKRLREKMTKTPLPPTLAIFLKQIYYKFQ